MEVGHSLFSGMELSMLETFRWHYAVKRISGYGCPVFIGQGYFLFRNSRSALTLSVRSHGNALRPKWP